MANNDYPENLEPFDSSGPSGVLQEIPSAVPQGVTGSYWTWAAVAVGIVIVAFIALSPRRKAAIAASA